MLAAAKTTATSAGCGAVLLWSSLALLTVRARGVPPFELLALSFAVASLAGLVVQAARGRVALLELRQSPGPWLVAFGGIFLYHALYFYALGAVPPARASLIAYLWPLLIVLLSAIINGGAERMLPRHVVGALLGLAGTAVLLRDHAGPAGSPAGYAAAFGCALVWSGYSVLNRRFAAVPGGMLVGVCAAVAIAGGFCHLLLEPDTVRPGLHQWFALVALGIGPTGLAFLAWDHATKHGHLALLGTISYAAPVLSTSLLIAAGDAMPTTSLLLAALLVIGGMIVATGLPLTGARR